MGQFNEEQGRVSGARCSVKPRCIGTRHESEREALCPQELEFAVAGEALVVRPLVLRDFKLVGDRLAEAYARLAERGDLTRVGVMELVALALAELPEVLALTLKRRAAEGLEPVDPGWLEQSLSAPALLDIVEAVIEVNDLPGILKKSESLRRRAQGSPAGE
jgi:hypothetical protein